VALQLPLQDGEAAIEGGGVSPGCLFDPDRRPPPRRHRQGAADRHPAARAIVVEEGHTHGDWSDAAAFQQVLHLLDHIDAKMALPSKSPDCGQHRDVSTPVSRNADTRLELTIKVRRPIAMAMKSTPGAHAAAKISGTGAPRRT